MATRWLMLVLSQILLLATNLMCDNASLKIKIRKKLNASCVLRSMYTASPGHPRRKREGVVLTACACAKFSRKPGNPLTFFVY